MKRDDIINVEVTESVARDTESQLGTVEGKIRSIVTSALPDVNYLYNDWTKVNVDLDRVPTPCICFVQPPSGTFHISHGRAKDYPDAMILFIDKTILDDNATNEDASVIERMKRLILRFVEAVNTSGEFEPIEGDVPYQVELGMFDSINSGVAIQPRLREKKGIMLCDTEPTR